MNFSTLLSSLRVYRFGPFSVVDTLGSLLIVYLIAPVLSWLMARIGLKVRRSAWLWLTIPAAVATHLAIGLDTPLARMILNPSGDYAAKLAVALMVLFGMSGIRRMPAKTVPQKESERPR